MTEQDTQTRDRPDRRIWQTGMLVGVGAGTAAYVGGVAVADRAATASIALAAAAAHTAWRLWIQRPKALILRYGVGLMLALGLLGAILAAIGPATPAPYMIFGAVGLTGTAVLVQAEAGDRPNVLSQIACVGSAVALVGWVDVGAQPSDQVVLIGLGVAIVGLVVADLVGWRPSDWGINLVVSGCIGAGVGVALLIGRHLPGIIFAGLGLTLVGLGVAGMVGWRPPGWITQAGAGLMAAGVGIAELIGRQLPVGIAFVVGGLASVGYGALAFHSRQARTLDHENRDGVPDQQKPGDQDRERSQR